MLILSEPTQAKVPKGLLGHQINYQIQRRASKRTLSKLRRLPTSPHHGVRGRLPRDAALSSASASPQSTCWLDEQRKLVTRRLIFDELPFSAAPQQLVIVLIAGEENPREKRFASVSRENKVRFLSLVARIAWDSQRELVLFFVAAAEGDNSGLQLLDRVAAGFQRSISHRKIERYVCRDASATLGMRRYNCKRYTEGSHHNE